MTNKALREKIAEHIGRLDMLTAGEVADCIMHEIATGSFPVAAPIDDEDALLDNIEDILFEHFPNSDENNPIGRAGYRVWKLARDFYAVSEALAVREAASPDLEAFQNDVRDLLHALDLPDHARPSSPHEVVRREVLPAIGNLQAKFLRALDISQNWLFMHSCCPAYCGSRKTDDGGVRDSGQPCTCGRKDLLIELSHLRGRRSHHASLFELVEATVACPVCKAPTGGVCVKNPGRKPRVPHQDRIRVYERVSRGQRTSES